MNKHIKRAAALMLAALMMISGWVQPAMAAEIEEYDTETGFPLLETVLSELSADEILTVENVSIHAGDAIELIDPEWLKPVEDEPVKFGVELVKVLGESGEGFSNTIPGVYTAYYVVVPVSGHPAYEISRTITVMAVEIPAEPVIEDAAPSEAADEEMEDDLPNEEYAESESADLPVEPAETPSEGEALPDGSENAGQETPVEQEGLIPAPEVIPEDIQPETPEQEAPQDIPEQEIITEGIILEVQPVEDSQPVELPTEPIEDDVPAPETAAPDDSEPEIMPEQAESVEPSATVEIQEPAGQNPPAESEPAADPMTSDAPAESADESVEAAETPAEGETETDSGAEAGETDPAEGEEEPEEGFEDDEEDDPENIVIEGPAKLNRGSKIKYPSDLGNYSTFNYTVDGKMAYCLEADKKSPKTGSFAQYILDTNPDLCKALYYGYGGPGDVTTAYFPNYSNKVRYVLTHIAASYMYTGDYSKATKGCTSSGLKKYGVEAWINYLKELPDPPSPRISLSETALTIVSNTGGVQTTGATKLNADSRNSITLALPDNVTWHNQDTGETQTGGSVQIAGGTTFYFSAPSSITGVWNTAEMNGTIDRIWKVLVIQTGTKTQDMGSYASETYSGTVSFSVEWNNEVQLHLQKVDSENTNVRLAGAVFGVFSDSVCSDQLASMTTDENGAASCTLQRTHDTVYLKELSAPDGYRLNRTVYTVDLTNEDSVTVMVKNEKQRAGLKITKKGEVLAGATVTSEGVEFIYHVRKLSGATYRVIADSSIYRADGSLMYQKGDVVAENLTTNADGEVFLNDLPLGKYLVEETAAPHGYVLASEAQRVSLVYAGQETEVAFNETTFINERQQASVFLAKNDGMTGHPLSGAQFALFAVSDILNADGETVVTAGTMIEAVSTGSDGKASFTADLPLGYEYCIRETRAPAGYMMGDEVFYFTFAASGQNIPVVEYTHTFTNEQIQANIHMKKVDAETETAQGDASLAGAVYGLYAREMIVAPEGAGGIYFEKDAQIATLTTNENGEASIGGLFPGNYYLKEITPSAGYLLDTMEYDVDCTQGETAGTMIIGSRTVKEQVIKQPFQIIKVANNGKTDADLLECAGFSAWLISDLSRNADGSYDFGSASPVALGADGATEIFTDSTGHAVSVPLPYGSYIVRETTTPANYSPVDDFIVNITENQPNTPQVWRVLLDEEFAAKLKIIKVDAATGRTILLEGAEFSIYDLDNETYVSQVTTYPQPATHTTFTTDASGTLTLPETLRPGRYRITEVSAPNGYLVNPEPVDVVIGEDSLYRIDALTGDPVIEVSLYDHAVKGRISVCKEGEMLVGYENGCFIFENRRLAGVTFDVYAAEDIFSADQQKDENGSRYLEYAAGTLVATLTTDANGEASTGDLPLGSYNIVEKQTVEGYVLDTKVHTVTIAYADETTPIVVSAANLANQRQKVAISVEKQSADGTLKLPGAEFALYAGEDIVADNRVLVAAGTCLATAVTDETGRLTFDIDLPMGKYLIGETKAPAGYILSDEVQEVEAAWQGQDTAVVSLNAVFTNEPVRVAISKADVTTGVELDGAKLTLLDSDGNVVDSWVSVAGKPHIIEGLTIGASYTLREEIAPYGYLITNAVKFTVGDTAEIQKVVIKDEAPTGTIIINKTGEFLSSVSVLDSSAGWIGNAFSYITGSLKDVTFGVYAYEDIRHADGASPNHYAAGDLITTITTDSTGIARLEGLPLGKYYVQEFETQGGYVLDDQIRVIDLSYRDSDTPVVTYSEAWQNERRKASVRVIKRAAETDMPLEGAVFGLYAAEDITSNGKIVMQKDTIIEQRATDSTGMLNFEADLPVGFGYYVAEIAPPDGYASDAAPQSFVFDADSQNAQFEFSFVNAPTIVDFTKSSLTTGEEVEGAKMQISDSDGNIIAEWTSAQEPHRITGLTVGKTYILTETLPAPGYVTAESISFTIQNTGEVQKVDMKDDVTRVQISKTDMGGTELPGAKLTILDTEGKVVETWVSGTEPHYIEMLPIGKYVLREEAAPSGYLIAEDIPFEVKDTGEIQKVVMRDAAEDKPGSGTPKTGDERKPLVWAASGIAGMVGILGAFLLLRNKRRR